MVSCILHFSLSEVKVFRDIRARALWRTTSDVDCRYTKEQVVGILKESESGQPNAELCRKYNLSKHTLCR